ncbi:hypothetical protein K443DRAFT_175352 [Laccaria amethystina LaAM-08-1]|uniref:Uncharacterized protein n=1 Tax=Laccaria amethystina LaAM-08-1 TaxID=1095629 RepID=A0A0C9XP18_9AGAR|nr:hypothetical protein K443DRAFT_175352 [Laccaria amethystina LaAM-08-1]
MGKISVYLGLHLLIFAFFWCLSPIRPRLRVLECRPRYDARTPTQILIVFSGMPHTTPSRLLCHSRSFSSRFILQIHKESSTKRHENIIRR